MIIAGETSGLLGVELNMLTPHCNTKDVSLTINGFDTSVRETDGSILSISKLVAYLEWGLNDENIKVEFGVEGGGRG
jgi:hypothetical protein